MDIAVNNDEVADIVGWLAVGWLVMWTCCGEMAGQIIGNVQISSNFF